MRIFLTQFGRQRGTEPVPFKELLPLKIKSTVSGKGSKTSEVCCIHEMSVLFSCLKDNEYEEKPCQKEIESFQKCYMDYLTDKNQRTDRETKGILAPHERKLTSKQLNKLLQRYPNL